MQKCRHLKKYFTTKYENDRDETGGIEAKVTLVGHESRLKEEIPGGRVNNTKMEERSKIFGPCFGGINRQE